jgi:hypothetical protein
MHDEELGIAITQFVEVALAGDQNRAVSYARHLSKCLKHAGDDETADQIDEMVNSRPVSVAKTVRQPLVETPIPVDSESRLPLADEHLAASKVKIVLPAECEKIVDRFLESIRHADELRSKGVSVPRSMLLHGPPGCGKTMLAHHIGQSLGKPVVTARADALVSSYLGSTAKNIRSLFDDAMRHECILFLDEFDAIAKMRDDRHELGELKRVVIALLQNIDAANDSLIFIAATNHQHLLDPAVWRRFSYAIEIPLPDHSVRQALLGKFFEAHLNKDSVSILASLTDGMSGAELKRLADDSLREFVLRRNGPVSITDIIRIMFLGHIRLSPGESKPSMGDAIKRIRQAHGKAISQTTLADVFGISQSRVSRILSES